MERRAGREEDPHDQSTTPLGWNLGDWVPVNDRVRAPRGHPRVGRPRLFTTKPPVGAIMDLLLHPEIVGGM